MLLNTGKQTNKTIMPYSTMATFAFRYSRNIGYVALIVLMLYSIGLAKNFGFFLDILGITILIAFASFASGGIVGFLFGIPHTVQQSSQITTPSTATQATVQTSTNIQAGGATTVSSHPLSAAANLSRSAPRTSFVPSTNLEQIANWLTKILVGVGLVQINKIMDSFNRLCTALGSLLENYTSNHHSAAAAGAIMIFSAILGFLIVYLWTYLYLIRIQDSMVDDIIDTINFHLQDSDLSDKRAIDVANTQLNAPEDAPDLPDQEICEAFSAASQKVLSSIFFMVVSIRKENWRQNPARMERMIPILKALIKLDNKFEFPENYSELGFGLKDKRMPEYAQAIQMFNKAVEGFKISDGSGYKAITYFNRAFCYIKMDANFNQNPPLPSTPQMRTLIYEDLNEAMKEAYVALIVTNSNEINEWKELNP